MNDFRNLGNANAALAALNFNQHDHFVDEFLHRLFRLIGEDAPDALLNGYFNKAHVVEMLDDMFDNLPIPNDDLPPPSHLDTFFRELANSIHVVKVEDHVVHTLVRQLQQENIGCHNQCTLSPPIEISDDDDTDDIYEEAPRQEDNTMVAARSELDSDIEMVLDPHDFIDGEAEEVPSGEESSPSVSAASTGASIS